MRIRSILLALLLLAPSAWAAPAASTPKAGCLSIEDGWIRLPPAPRPMLAGFGRIINRCADARELVAVRSPRFGEVSLHETRMVDGVSRMRGIERLPVAAGGEALMQPDATLVEGERVPLVLVLADGSEVPATLAVRKAAP